MNINKKRNQSTLFYDSVKFSFNFNLIISGNIFHDVFFIKKQYVKKRTEDNFTIISRAAFFYWHFALVFFREK